MFEILLQQVPFYWIFFLFEVYRMQHAGPLPMRLLFYLLVKADVVLLSNWWLRLSLHCPNNNKVIKGFDVLLLCVHLQAIKNRNQECLRT